MTGAESTLKPVGIAEPTGKFVQSYADPILELPRVHPTQLPAGSGRAARAHPGEAGEEKIEEAQKR